MNEPNENWWCGDVPLPTHDDVDDDDEFAC